MSNSGTLVTETLDFNGGRDVSVYLPSSGFNHASALTCPLQGLLHTECRQAVPASGELALALGLRHPEVFSVVLSASPGAGYRTPDSMPARLPRTYLIAGTLEPFFFENATRWADALEVAGADVVIKERVGGHGDPFWREELPSMVRWAFG